MNSEIDKIEHSSSLLNKKWKLIDYDERNASYLSQKFELSSMVGKLLSIRHINEENINFYLNLDINQHIPNPNKIKNMGLATSRVVEAIKKKSKNWNNSRL